MAHPRGVAEWFSLGFEHSADVFCHHCGAPADLSPVELKSLDAVESVPAHPQTDKGVVIGND